MDEAGHFDEKSSTTSDGQCEVRGVGTWNGLSVAKWIPTLQSRIGQRRADA